MKDIKNGIYSRFLILGFYHHRPDKVVGAYIGSGIALLVFMVMEFGFFGDALSISTGLSAVAALLSAAPVINFGLVMSARTVKGTR